MSKTLFGHTYSDDSLTKTYEAVPVAQVSEPATTKTVGGQTYNYNGLTRTWNGKF